MHLVPPRQRRALKKRYVEQGGVVLLAVVEEADLVPDYRVTCIFVDKRYRRRGLTETALLGAVDLISRAGGGVVEGYPHVPGDKRMSSSFLYNGTRAMYERCGFEFVRPKGLKNTVMRRAVAAAADCGPPRATTTARSLERASPEVYAAE